MPRGRPDDINTRIILSLVENLGGGDISNRLSDINRRLGSTQKSMGKWGSLASKTMFQVGKAAGVASLAIGGLGVAALTAFKAMSSLSQAGKSFVKLGVATGKGSQAAEQLRKSYKSLISTSGQFVMSMNDMADAMSDFANQGFGQMQMAADEGMQKFIGSLQDTFFAGLGDTKAASQMTSNLTKAFGDNLAALNAFKNSWNAAGDNMYAKMSALQDIEFIDPQGVRQQMGALTQAIEASEGRGDPAIRMTLAWQTAMKQIGTSVEQIKQTIIEVFGGDLAGAVIKVQTWLQKLIKNIVETAKWLDKMWAGAKAIFSNLAEAAKVAWNVMAGAFQGAISVIMTGLAELWKHLPWVDQSSIDQMARWAIDMADAAEKNLSYEGKFVSVSKAMDDAAKKWEKDQKTITKATTTTKKALSAIQQKLKDNMSALLPLVQQSKAWSEQLKSVNEAIGITAGLAEMMGGSISLAGKSFQQMTNEGMAQAVSTGRELLMNAEKALPLANEQIALYDEELSRLKAQSASQDKIALMEKARNTAVERRKSLLADVEGYYKTINDYIDNALASRKADLTLTEAVTSLEKTRLSISQSVYGSAGLAVQNQMRVVEQLEQQKSTLTDMINIARERVEQLKAQGVNTDEMRNVQKKLIDLEQQRANILAEQVSMVKELRDGYLDAVQAQAFGAGKFEKIIITQEQNIAKALDKRIAKESFLVGQVGDAAGRSKVGSTRFGAGGLGQLQDTATGQNLSAEDVRRRNTEMLKNISDPGQRAMAMASQNLFNGIANQMNSTTKMQVESISENTASLDKVTNSFNEFSSIVSGKVRGMAATGALGKGGPAAETGLGEASRKALDGSGGGFLGKILQALTYAGPGKPTAAQQATSAQKKLTDYLGQNGTNISGSNVHGFDMRTRSQALADRRANAKHLRKLQRDAKLAARRAQKEKAKQDRIRSREMPTTSLSGVRGGSGTNKNIKLGKKSSPQDWTGKLRMAADIFRQLGPVLEEWMSGNNEPETMRSTRQVNTAAGGPGT